MLDRMYKEYPKRSAPGVLETLAEKIRTADAFVLVTGDYNWGAAGLQKPDRPFPRGVVRAAGGYFQLFGEPTGDGGAALVKAFPRFADDLAWWTNAARLQPTKGAPPY